MKNFYKFTPNKTLTALLLIGVTFSLANIVNAVQANPGHDISTLGGVVLGDILYGSGTDVVSKLTGAAGFLKSTGAAAPTWSAVNLAASDVSGLLPIANGGTGTSTATNAFNSLSPITTKGDLISSDGTNDVRVAVGTNGQVLTASSTATAGVTWATSAGGGGSPGGADTQIQFNNASAFGGSANFTWNNATNKLTLGGTDTGIIFKTITNEPAVPTTGTGHLYAKSIGGRVLPKFVGPSGIDFAIQPLMAQDKVAIWSPPGNATTLPGVFSFTAPTSLSTVTARSVGTGNLFARVRRLGFVTSTTAGSVTGHYNVSAGTQWTVGTGAGLGGFFYVTRFGESSAATVAGSREFVGMTSNVSAPTNVEPSTLTNSIGVGYGAADTNLKLYYGGSAAQTAIDLGASFPIRTLSTDMYELILFASPATSTSVGYKVTRLNTNNVAEGTISGTAGTAIPASTTLLGHRAWITNNATALAVGIDVASIYISSDY